MRGSTSRPTSSSCSASAASSLVRASTRCWRGGRLAADGRSFVVAIGGGGRDRDRLERVARATGAPARFLGRVDDVVLPALYGTADLFAMLCRNDGSASSRRGSASCSSKPRQPASPSSPGRAGERPRRSSTASRAGHRSARRRRCGRPRPRFAPRRSRGTHPNGRARSTARRRRVLLRGARRPPPGGARGRGRMIG